MNNYDFVQSSEIFGLFDNLLILERGGRQTYFGSRDGAVTFFESAGSAKLEADANPAEFLLEVNGAGINTGAGFHSELIGPASGSLSTIDWSRRWKESEQRKEVEEEIDRLVGQSCNRPRKIVSKDAVPGVLQQTVELTKRMSRHFWRGRQKIFY
jgi:ATP-binding cassette, subfamily G (WHITE), member 2, SNQ2